MLARYSFTNILQSNISVHQLRFGPIISYLLFTWGRVEKSAGCSSGWGLHSPIFSNDELLIGGRSICFPDWEKNGEGAYLRFRTYSM